MLLYVDKTQLYKKHKGINDDPYEYWPPQVPGQARMKFYE